MIFIAFMFAFILIIAMRMGLAFCFYARAEIAKAADAAPLTSAAEISQRVFEETGDLQPTSKTRTNTQAYASMNNSYLAQYGINAVVSGIIVDTGKDTVLVEVSASLEKLFPSIILNVSNLKKWLCSDTFICEIANHKTIGQV